jgi:hypothetical protein
VNSKDKNYSIRLLEIQKADDRNKFGPLPEDETRYYLRVEYRCDAKPEDKCQPTFYFKFVTKDKRIKGQTYGNSGELAKGYLGVDSSQIFGGVSTMGWLLLDGPKAIEGALLTTDVSVNEGEYTAQKSIYFVIPLIKS